MSHQSFPVVKAAGKRRILNARKDTPDIRDRMYEPALIQLRPELDNRDGTRILDQGQEGACTGFGLAAVINLLSARRSTKPFYASPRMLYEMARKHDEWPGEDYDGSSCRGAIRGWKNMGVCSEDDWAYSTDAPGELTIERAKAARATTLGAYYRLRPEINDYHAALNEAGAVYVSADVHGGWFSPTARKKDPLAVIKPSGTIEGGHAFAIVGYNSQGFMVQNSWGKGWGTGGFAVWLYEDWIETISDGWVFRLAIPTPQIFGLTARSRESRGEAFSAPKRLEIAGHFVHFDDGRFKERGNFWSSAEDVLKTAAHIRESVGTNKYGHLLIWAHGGLNSQDDSAHRVAALLDGFKRNGIYPFHIMYDTGLAEEIKDALIRAKASRPMQGLPGSLIETCDRLIEDLVRKPVTPIWEEMKNDARRPFDTDGDRIRDGLFTIRAFVRALGDTGIRIHLAGHSTGAILLGHLLGALDTLGMPDLVASCSLMAPACSLDFYTGHYAPRLGEGDGRVGLPKLDIYTLSDRLELDDTVALVYRKSLLFLVSRALERTPEKPLLGMQRHLGLLEPNPALTVLTSDGKRGASRCTTHCGFDNDAPTMNAILKRVLGKYPSKPFREGEMAGY
ncbi:MAG: C1 family peptidase [Pseudomonadota bacterium]